MLCGMLSCLAQAYLTPCMVMQWHQCGVCCILQESFGSPINNRNIYFVALGKAYGSLDLLKIQVDPWRHFGLRKGSTTAAENAPFWTWSMLLPPHPAPVAAGILFPSPHGPGYLPLPVVAILRCLVCYTWNSQKAHYATRIRDISYIDVQIN